MTKWKLVPVEPTPEMIASAEKQWMVGSAIDMASREYKAMLEAAPQPPKLSDERIDELIEEHAPDTKRRYCVDFARAIEREIMGGGT